MNVRMYLYRAEFEIFYAIRLWRDKGQSQVALLLPTSNVQPHTKTENISDSLGTFWCNNILLSRKIFIRLRKKEIMYTARLKLIIKQHAE